MSRHLFAVLAGLAMLTSGGCADGARPNDGLVPVPGPVPILASRSHAQCPADGIDSRQLRFADAAQWRAVVQVDEAVALGRPVDWSVEQVVLHAMAQRPTLGYDVVAVDAQALADGSLQLRLRERRPPPDAMVGMAFTRPCVFVVLPATRWTAVDVRDADQDRSLGRAVDPAGETRRPGAAVGGPATPVPVPRDQAR